MVFHEPVLLDEVLSLLVTDRHGTYYDGTLGGGAHCEEIVKALSPDGRVIGTDLDEEAIRFASTRLRAYKSQVTLRQGNFKDLAVILQDLKIKKLTGVLLDLGISSHQIDTAERGFSFDREGSLDMRMNVKQTVSAHDVIQSYDAEELARLFRDFGQEKKAKTLARLITKERETTPIDTTARLKEIIAKVTPFKQRAKSLARVFQALRIEVNRELDNLSEALEASLDSLASGGRLVVISYQSLEDATVKRFFKREVKRCICPPELPVCMCGKKGRLKILTQRPITPTAAEIERNSRSRSAKMRAAEIL